ncbi:hypothetical protein MTO96_015287 [Rhipicephalus appendiculatus]
MVSNGCPRPVCWQPTVFIPLPVGANKRPLRELHTTPLLQAETPPDKTELSLPPPWVIATLPAETPVEGAPPTDDRRQRLVTMFQFFLRESF